MDDRRHNNIPIGKKTKVDVREASLEIKFQQALNKEIKDKKNIFSEILEIIDDIDRIINNKEDESESYKYLDIMRKKMLKLLEKHGVTQMRFKDNKAKFGWCEVVGTEKAEGLDDETIIREVRKGYLCNDKTLRLASVIIVKNKE